MSFLNIKEKKAAGLIAETIGKIAEIPVSEGLLMPDQAFSPSNASKILGTLMFSAISVEISSDFLKAATDMYVSKIKKSGMDPFECGQLIRNASSFLKSCLDRLTPEKDPIHSAADTLTFTYAATVYEFDRVSPMIEVTLRIFAREFKALL